MHSAIISTKNSNTKKETKIMNQLENYDLLSKKI